VRTFNRNFALFHTTGEKKEEKKKGTTKKKVVQNKKKTPLLYFIILLLVSLICVCFVLFCFVFCLGWKKKP